MNDTIRFAVLVVLSCMAATMTMHIFFHRPPEFQREKPKVEMFIKHNGDWYQRINSRFPVPPPKQEIVIAIPRNIITDESVVELEKIANKNNLDIQIAVSDKDGKIIEGRFIVGIVEKQETIAIDENITGIYTGKTMSDSDVAEFEPK